MSGNRRPRLTYANVTATLALMVALGGTSWAAPARDAASRLITGKQLKNGAVTEKKLSKQVRAKLKRVGKTGPQGPIGPKGPAGSDATVNGVAAGGVLTGTFPSPGLAVDAVTTSTIGTGAVTGPKLAANSIGAVNVTNGSLKIADVSRLSFLSNVDFASISANSCQLLNVTLPSGLDDPVVIANPPGNFASLNLPYAINIGINNSDPINIRVCNNTAGPIDPPGGGWRFVVFDG